MLMPKESIRVLALMILLFVCGSTAKTQSDCVYGYRIHIRDASGKPITTGKVEVFGLSERDKLPAAFRNVYRGELILLGSLCMAAHTQAFLF